MSLKILVSTPLPMEDGPHGRRIGRPTFEWLRARLDLVTPLTTSLVPRWDYGFPVDEARNFSAQAAIDAGCDYLFFIDWDVIPKPQSLHQLVMRAQSALDCDIFSGVYTSRHYDWPAPLVYVGPDQKISYDWTAGDVLTSEEHDISGFGMGLALIRTSLFERLSNTPEKPWFKTTETEMVRETEDLWFIKRAMAEAGSKLMVDTALLAWHIDPKTGTAYNLPPDSAPIVRWREKAGLGPNMVPYDMSAVMRARIGQQIGDCSELPPGARL
jgi:hypothetical protein